jgi:hypothetical protein
MSGKSVVNELDDGYLQVIDAGAYLVSIGVQREHGEALASTVASDGRATHVLLEVLRPMKIKLTIEPKLAVVLS